MNRGERVQGSPPSLFRLKVGGGAGRRGEGEGEWECGRAQEQRRYLKVHTQNIL